MSDPRKLLAALMRGDERPIDVAPQLLLQLASKHGAVPLLAHHHGLFAEEARMLAAYDIVRERELETLLDAFAAAGVPLVVMKGAALARTLYPRPSLRPRCDTDVLLDRDDVERAVAVLSASGYAEEISSGGELISTQRMWVRVDSLGLRHCIDLHWALSNRPRYARALLTAELRSRGVELRPGIAMPSPADALLIAALHLAGHHRGDERLIWLYDIHLLHAKLSAAELEEAALRARERNLGMALDVALALALRWFGEGREVASQATAKLVELADDLRHTPGIRRKLRLVREHLFPAAHYVMQKYGARNRAMLPVLYMRRAVGALLRRGT